MVSRGQPQKEDPAQPTLGPPLFSIHSSHQQAHHEPGRDETQAFSESSGHSQAGKASETGRQTPWHRQENCGPQRGRNSSGSTGKAGSVRQNKGSGYNETRCVWAGGSALAPVQPPVRTGQDPAEGRGSVNTVWGDCRLRDPALGPWDLASFHPWKVSERSTCFSKDFLSMSFGCQVQRALFKSITSVK